MNDLNTTGKIPYLTLAQVVSAFAVVFLHTNGCFWTFSTERWWITANMIECVFYFAVPVFFMITGVTLINFPERYDLRTYFRKRIRKTVLPFIAWSLIGLGYQCLRGAVQTEELTIPYVLNRLLKADAIPIYWFFPPLFSLYLSIPVFAAVPREKRGSVFGYLLFAALLCNVCIPFLIQIFHLDFGWNLSVGVASGYLILVLGAVYLHENPPGVIGRIVIYLLGAAGLLAMILGTQGLSLAAGEIVRTYKGYTNLPGLCYSFALFVLFSRVGPPLMASPVGGLLRLLAKYSFPIYLIHWYVMDALVRVFHLPTTAIWYRLGAPFVIVPIVIGITWLLRRIPGVRAIVP